MPNIDDLPEGQEPVHLLLIGDSKTGKSTYTIDALVAGFNVVYFDSDNGLSAARYVINQITDPALRAVVKARFHYFQCTKNPDDFLRQFLKSTTKSPLRWIPDNGMLWGRMATNVEPDTKVWELDSTKINPNWLVAKDSWTSVASAALGLSSSTDAAELLEGVNQSIYGEANVNLTYICNMLQKVPYHVIVQAHGTKYEEYDKPVGMSGVEAGKQKNMILRAITHVPASSSRPHGQLIASRFNHIGWLYVNGLGATDIDFTRKPERIGGGPPNKKAGTKDLTFEKLVGGIKDQTAIEGWYTERTHAELMELTDPKRGK